MLVQNFKDIINNIKEEINTTQIMAMSDVNKRLIELYFKIGKTIYENYNWGDKFVENLEMELKISFPNTKGFSARNLRRMKKFYTEYMKNETLPLAVTKISWSHNVLLFEKINDRQKRLWYANEAANNNWSKVVLEHQIDLNLYERQNNINKLNNYNNTLVEPQSDLANDLQKDPYIFNLPFLKENFIERELEQAMIEKIRDVLLELGNGFSFVGNQYKIVVGDNDYYVDMLFYHLKLHCYVAVELKTVPFQPEFIGKLNFYLNVIDEEIKTENDNPTIGLLLCKGKDKLTVEYALRNVNKPIGISSYEIVKFLPEDFQDKLPTEEDLNLHIDIKEI